MQRPYKGKFLLLPVVFVALMVSPSVFAQETTAGLQGVVRDPSGASVANATVELTGSSLIGSKKVQTDDLGTYRFAALPSGSYALTVTVPGFRTYKQVGIDLVVGRLPNCRCEAGSGRGGGDCGSREQCFDGRHHAEQSAGDGYRRISWITSRRDGPSSR